MRGGIKALLATTLLASAGCAADKGQLEVRAIADPLTKAIGPGDPAIAEARGLLAMGSVGLAIEAYRKVLRDKPDSFEALAGLAECYDQMGRYDLSRAKYERALAIAPKNPVLLRTFAASLERQGRAGEALALRAEATADERARAKAAAVQPNPVLAASKTADVQPKPVPVPIGPAERVAAKSAPASVSIAKTPPMPAPAGRTEWTIEASAAAPMPAAAASVTVKLPPVRFAEAPTVVAATPPIVESAHLAAVELARIEVPKAAPPAGPSITVKLPPPAAPAKAPRRTAAAVAPHVPALPASPGPRLERLSLGEVALVTGPRPRWKSAPVRYAAVGAVPSFVPLADLQRRKGLRILNAARHQGLAARTRVALNRQGWTGVTIGDSGRVRQKSLILYSATSEQAARRLSARLGIWIAKEARPGPLTILLGRDWVTRGQPGA